MPVSRQPTISSREIADYVGTSHDSVLKTGTAEHGDSSQAYVHYKFTPKGVGWIAGEWAKHQVAQKVGAV